MSNGIDDLYPEDSFDATGDNDLDGSLNVDEKGNDDEINDEGNTPNIESDNEFNDEKGNDDLIYDLLLNKNLDPHNIIVENEQGIQEKIDFRDLDYEERMAILSETEQESNGNEGSLNLNQDESEFFNILRSNNLTVNQALTNLKEKIESDFIERDNYDFDNWDDEDLYVADLQNRYPNFTEEDITNELEKELENPDRFKNKVDQIRNLFKENQRKEKEYIIALKKEEKEKHRNDVINKLNFQRSVSDIELEDQDRKEIMNHLFEKNINDKTNLEKTLSTPEGKIKLAWFDLYGERAISEIKKQYEDQLNEKLKEIDKIRKLEYERGKREAIQGAPTKPLNFYSRTRTRTRQQSKGNGISDLYD